MQKRFPFITVFALLVLSNFALAAPQAQSQKDDETDSPAPYTLTVRVNQNGQADYKVETSDTSVEPEQKWIAVDEGMLVMPGENPSQTPNIFFAKDPGADKNTGTLTAQVRGGRVGGRPGYGYGRGYGGGYGRGGYWGGSYYPYYYPYYWNNGFYYPNSCGYLGAWPYMYYNYCW